MREELCWYLITFFFTHLLVINMTLMHVKTLTHRWINNSRLLTVVTHPPYVHKLHLPQRNWSSCAVSSNCKARVSHLVTPCEITLPQHKEEAAMRDGFCALVPYRPCFAVSLPRGSEICFHILHTSELLSRGAKRILYHSLFKVSEYQGSFGLYFWITVWLPACCCCILVCRSWGP